MPDPTPIDHPAAWAAQRVFNALEGAGLDIAQKIGILETCKHCLLSKAVEAAGDPE